MILLFFVCVWFVCVYTCWWRCCWQTNTDERLQHISELLMGIKIIKLNAWEKVFAEKIQRSRDDELKCLNKDSVYWTIMSKLYCAFCDLMLKVLQKYRFSLSLSLHLV